MVTIVGLDFETYCDVDIKKHGLDRYVNDPSFTPLLACVQAVGWGGPSSFDFVLDTTAATDGLLRYLDEVIANGDSTVIAAYNAQFERAVLRHIGAPRTILRRVVDSAVVARIMGGADKLEFAAPQLLGTVKVTTGPDLIRLFSRPNEWNGGKAPTQDLILGDQQVYMKWMEFKRYCSVDADLSAEILETFWDQSSVQFEFAYEPITAAMNELGWKVDVDALHEMQLMYEHNVSQALAEFRKEFDPAGELNFNSNPQLQRWCEARGIKAKSFDEEHVEKMLRQITKRLDGLPPDHPKWQGYYEVKQMLLTKQALGGASLRKLATIENLIGPGNRLRYQYMHCGAGQTYRTSAKGVQMQNLKRLSEEVTDLDELLGMDVDNDSLGRNLRQLFTASEPDGFLIVGDFSSVESRGLAWVAGADWKVDAYRHGKDMYKVLASKFFNVDYDAVTKPQRQAGKVGELSCGYGAGPGAVQSFAADMGIELTEQDALDIVRDWRATNPEVVELWDKLDDGLKRAVSTRADHSVRLDSARVIRFKPIKTPQSLRNQHAGAVTIAMSLWIRNVLVFERVFQGCYSRGRNICYYKPSSLQKGELWRTGYKDPKTGEYRYYDLYGGKLAGILVQSMCRELFFRALRRLSMSLEQAHNANIIGQFHDEIVVDWVPGPLSLEATVALMNDAMTRVDSQFIGFPMNAEIKHAYRYIK